MQVIFQDLFCMKVLSQKIQLNYLIDYLMIISGIGPDKIDYLYFPAFFSSSEVFTNVLLHKGERLEEWKKETVFIFFC